MNINSYALWEISKARQQEFVARAQMHRLFQQFKAEPAKHPSLRQQIIASISNQLAAMTNRLKLHPVPVKSMERQGVMGG